MATSVRRVLLIIISPQHLWQGGPPSTHGGVREGQGGEETEEEEGGEKVKERRIFVRAEPRGFWFLDWLKVKGKRNAGR